MAIYTPISDDELTQLLAHYDIGSLVSFEGIHEGVENTNYHLITDQSRYIVTIYEGRTSLKHLPFFHDVMNHLHHQSIPCPVAIATREGRTLHHIADKPCAITNFLQGTSVTSVTPQHCHDVGQLLAHFHVAGLSFTAPARANDLSLPAWRAIITHEHQEINQWQGGLSSMLERELNFLQTHWRDDVPQGIIHGDLFPDNVFFQNNQLVGVIDFYFACHDALCYDFAIAVNAWCFDSSHRYDAACGEALWSGYQSVRAFESTEKEFLPIALRASALRFLLTRLQDWSSASSLQQTKNPQDYLTRLQFHASNPIAWGEL